MAQIQTKAVLVRLSIRIWEARKQDRKATRAVEREFGTEGNAGNFHKKLLSSDLLEQIKKLAGTARTYHYEHTLPWFVDGTALLPTKSFLEYSRQMEDYRIQLDRLKDQFVDNYDMMVANARTQLGDLFNANDYPPSWRLKERFEFTWAYLPVPEAADFRCTLTEAEEAELKANCAKALAQANTDALKQVMERMYNTVSGLHEKIKVKPGDAGSVFRDSTVENLKEMTQAVKALNITDDPQVEAIRLDIEQKLAHYEPEQLRKDQAARDDATRQAEKLLEQMKGLMAVKQ